MYHEEKAVDGVLYVKGTPNGAWERLTSARADALLLMYKLRQESPEHYEWVLRELGVVGNWVAIEDKEVSGEKIIPGNKKPIVITDLEQVDSDKPFSNVGVPGKCCAGCIYCAPDKYLPRNSG